MDNSSLLNVYHFYIVYSVLYDEVNNSRNTKNNTIL